MSQASVRAAQWAVLEASPLELRNACGQVLAEVTSEGTLYVHQRYCTPEEALALMTWIRTVFTDVTEA